MAADLVPIARTNTDLEESSPKINKGLLKDFIAFLDVTPKTTATYSRALRQLFTYFKEQNIARPAHEDILNFKRALQARGLKPATISLYMAATRRFFLWLEQSGIYPNVSAGIKGAKQQAGHKRDFLSAQGIKAALAGITDKRDYALFSLIACCGLRTIEVSRANIEDLRTLGDTAVLYVQGKGRSDKTEFVKIPVKLLRAINAYLETRGHVSADEPLFVSTSNRSKNKRLSTRTISGICKHAMKEAGYDSTRLTAHSLRHSAVTLALMSGLSLQEVSAFARHSSVSTTQIYAHDIDRLKSTCEDSIADVIF